MIFSFHKIFYVVVIHLKIYNTHIRREILFFYSFVETLMKSNWCSSLDQNWFLPLVELNVWWCFSVSFSFRTNETQAGSFIDRLNFIRVWLLHVSALHQHTIVFRIFVILYEHTLFFYNFTMPTHTPLDRSIANWCKLFFIYIFFFAFLLLLLFFGFAVTANKYILFEFTLA